MAWRRAFSLSSELFFEGQFDGFVSDPGVGHGVSGPEGEPAREPRREVDLVGLELCRPAAPGVGLLPTNGSCGQLLV